MLPPQLAESALEWAPDAIVICDASGSIVFANRQVSRLFGYDASEILGTAIERLLSEGFQARAAGADQQLYARRKDHSEFPVEVRLGTMREAGQELFLTIIRDITDRKRIAAELAAARELAERESQAKTRFLATASHDLRQPLQALSLLNGVLRRLNVDTDSSEPLAQEEKAIEAMSRLVNALLDISKLESGAVEPQITRFSLTPMLQELRQEFGGLASSKGLGLGLEIDSGEIAVETDPALLEQVLRNLLSNAIKYTPRGKVVVCCRSEAAAVHLEVIDTGIGIAAEQLPLIFEEFYQCDAPRAARQGYGLGLSIVNRIVKLLGLTLEVHSVIGQGSTFRLRIASVARQL